MLEIYGDIWDLARDYDAIVITTNGFVKKNGEAVMGRGIALEAKNRYPVLPQYLGYMLKMSGNHVYIFADYEWNPYIPIFTFPVKPEFGPQGQPGWRAWADIKLIKQSATELVTMINEFAKGGAYQKILMPRPGCGNGGLKWVNIKPVIEPLLDDRFTVAHFDGK